MSFRILGLAPEPFAHLCALSDTGLAEHGAVRKIASADTGFPCRISLIDAARGDEVMLVNDLVRRRALAERHGRMKHPGPERLLT